MNLIALVFVFDCWLMDKEFYDNYFLVLNDLKFNLGLDLFKKWVENNLIKYRPYQVNNNKNHS